MSRRQGSAAVHTAPQSAETVPQLLAEARRDAAVAAAHLASACRDPEASPEHLVRAADAVLDAAGRVRGFAFLSLQ
jgi:hypothetical protein